MLINEILARKKGPKDPRPTRHLRVHRTRRGRCDRRTDRDRQNPSCDRARVEAIQHHQRVAFVRVADRCERRSTIVTTKLAISKWVQVIGDEKLTNALLDRFGHQAHILTTNGLFVVSPVLAPTEQGSSGPDSLARLSK